MDERPQRSRYDLEERTFEFARRCRAFVRTLPRTITIRSDAAQLVDASGSVAANYIEANEALSRKDFRMRIRISRKEAKESGLWLRLLGTAPGVDLVEQSWLWNESIELVKILSAILVKSQAKQDRRFDH